MKDMKLMRMEAIHPISKRVKHSWSANSLHWERLPSWLGEQAKKELPKLKIKEYYE